MDEAARLVKESNKKDGHMKRIARMVYDQKHAQLMATIKLEQMFPDGGFFPQAGTNLTASAANSKHRKASCEAQSKTPLNQKHPLNLLLLSGVLLCLVCEKDIIVNQKGRNEN